MCKLP